MFVKLLDDIIVPLDLEGRPLKLKSILCIAGLAINTNDLLLMRELSDKHVRSLVLDSLSIQSVRMSVVFGVNSFGICFTFSVN